MLAIADELTVDGLVLRYRVETTDDGLQGEEGTFTICSFWLVSALAEIGEIERARELCEKLLSYASPLLLYAEEIDPHSGRHLGNFPQAFTHLALINAVMHIVSADQDLTETPGQQLCRSDSSSSPRVASLSSRTRAWRRRQARFVSSAEPWVLRATRAPALTRAGRALGASTRRSLGDQLAPDATQRIRLRHDRLLHLLGRRERPVETALECRRGPCARPRDAALVHDLDRREQRPA